VKVGLQTPPRMQGSWSDNNIETMEAVVESSKGVDYKPSPSVESSPQYYHRWGHWHQWHLRTMRNY